MLKQQDRKPKKFNPSHKNTHSQTVLNDSPSFYTTNSDKHLQNKTDRSSPNGISKHQQPQQIKGKKKKGKDNNLQQKFKRQQYTGNVNNQTIISIININQEIIPKEQDKHSSEHLDFNNCQVNQLKQIQNTTQLNTSSLHQRQLLQKLKQSNSEIENLQSANIKLQNENQAIYKENGLLKMQRHQQKLKLQNLKKQCSDQINLIEIRKGQMRQSRQDITKQQNEWIIDKQKQNIYINKQKAQILQFCNHFKDIYPFMKSIIESMGQQSQIPFQSFDKLNQQEDLIQIQQIKSIIQIISKIDTFLKTLKDESLNNKIQMEKINKQVELKMQQFIKSEKLKSQKIKYLEQKITQIHQKHTISIEEADKDHQNQIQSTINLLNQSLEIFQSDICSEYQKMINFIPLMMKQFIESCQNQKIKQQEDLKIKVQQLNYEINAKTNQLRQNEEEKMNLLKYYQGQIQILKDNSQKLINEIKVKNKQIIQQQLFCIYNQISKYKTLMRKRQIFQVKNRQTHAQQLANQINAKTNQIQSINEEKMIQQKLYKDQIQRLKACSEQLINEINLKKDQIININEEKNNQHTSYQNQIETLKYNYSQLTQEINRKKDQIQKINQKNVNQNNFYQNQIKTIKNNYQKEKTQITEKWEGEQQILQSANRQLQNEIVSFQQHIDILVKSCQDKEKVIQQQRSMKLSEIKALRKQHENTLHKANERKQQQIRISKSELNSLHQLELNNLSLNYNKQIEILTKSYKQSIQKEDQINSELKDKIVLKQQAIQMLQIVLCQNKVTIQKQASEYQDNLLNIKEEVHLLYQTKLEQMKQINQTQKQLFYKNLNQEKKIELATMINAKRQIQQQFLKKSISKQQSLRAANQQISSLKSILTLQTTKIQSRLKELKAIEKQLQQSCEQQLQKLKIQLQNTKKDELQKQRQQYNQIMKQYQQKYRLTELQLQQKHKNQMDVKDSEISDIMFKNGNVVEKSQRQKKQLYQQIRKKDYQLGTIILKYEQEQRKLRQERKIRENQLIAKLQSLAAELQDKMMKNKQYSQQIIIEQSQIDELKIQLKNLLVEITKRDNYIGIIKQELESSLEKIQKLVLEAQVKQQQRCIDQEQVQTTWQKQVKELNDKNLQNLAKTSRLCQEFIESIQSQYNEQLTFYSGKCDKLEESLMIQFDLYELQAASLKEQVSQLLLNRNRLQDEFSYFKTNKNSQIEELKFQLKESEIEIGKTIANLKTAQEKIDRFTQSEQEIIDYLMEMRSQKGEIIRQRLPQIHDQSPLIIKLKQLFSALLHQQSKLQTCNQQLFIKIGQLESKIQIYKNTQSQLLESSSQSKHENQILKEKLSILQTQIQNKLKQIKNFEDVQSQQKLQIQKLILQQSTLNANLSDLQQNSIQFQLQKRQLTLENEKLTNQLKDQQNIFNNSLNDKIEKNQQLKEQLQTMVTLQKQEINKMNNYQSEINNLKTENYNLNRLKEDLNNEINYINLLSDDLRNNNANLQSSLKQCQLRISSLNEEANLKINSLKQQKDNLGTQIQQKKSQNERLTNIIENLQRQIRETRLSSSRVTYRSNSNTTSPNLQNSPLQSPTSSRKMTFFSNSSLVDMSEKNKEFLINKIYALCKKKVVSTQLVYSMQNNNNDFSKVFSGNDLADKFYSFIFYSKQKKTFGITTYRESLNKGKNSAFLFCLNNWTIVNKRPYSIERQSLIKCETGQSLIFVNNTIVIKNLSKYIQVNELKSQSYFQRFDKLNIFGKNDRSEPMHIEIEDFQIHRLDISR